MELTCLPGIDIGGMFGRHYQWVTDSAVAAVKYRLQVELSEQGSILCFLPVTQLPCSPIDGVFRRCFRDQACQ
ncbi:MAG: hypothetical protein PHT80_00935 [Lentisphaeria bacterium]|nr:hypothetical protein [Lentisphaeria bacterium]